MGRPSKTALIGYGYWGEKLYRYLTENSDLALKYVHFPSLARLIRAQIDAQYGPKFVAEIETIWEDRSVESVVIATPINTHYEIARTALLRGKHVLVEKPLAARSEECADLKRLALECGLKLQTEYTYQFSPALNHAAELVRSRRIGELQSITIALKQLGRFLPNDILTLLASHALSIMAMFVPISELEFEVSPLMMNDGLITGALIRFFLPHGMSGYINVTAHSHVREKQVTLYGEKGTLIFNPQVPETLTLASYRRKPGLRGSELITKQESFRFDEQNNLGLAVQAFAQVLKGDRAANTDESIAVTTALEKMGAR